MKLWHTLMNLVNEFESCCSRKRTFFWLVVVLMGFTIKSDFLGVTSLARAVNLLPNYYTCLLNFFHSAAVDLEMLKILWAKMIFKYFDGMVRINGRCVILGDGIKVGKEGKKMPGVKWLHQSSDNNGKAAYIMGHSMQVLALLVRGLSTVFAVPLAGEIHEGLRFDYRDKQTQLDKLFVMLLSVKLPELCYLVADKYYCAGRLMKQLISKNIHLITMMKRHSVAYYPVEKSSSKKGKGRPKTYGKRVKLFDLFHANLDFIEAVMPNHPGVLIHYAVKELLWKPLGLVVKFVFVRHPEKGNAIILSTDCSLSALDIITGYSLRFKIEVMFKQAIYQLGTFMYRFWLKAMAPIKRGQEGDQQLQFAPKAFKDEVKKKIAVYHLFIQLGLIAQGLVQYLSIHHHKVVFKSFGTWLRTLRENTLPSEMVVCMALKNTYLDFLLDGEKFTIFKKFLGKRTGVSLPMNKIPVKRKAA